jgi:hypothetical protein
MRRRRPRFISGVRCAIFGGRQLEIVRTDGGRVEQKGKNGGGFEQKDAKDAKGEGDEAQLNSTLVLSGGVPRELS